MAYKCVHDRSLNGALGQDVFRKRKRHPKLDCFSFGWLRIQTWASVGELETGRGMAISVRQEPAYQIGAVKQHEYSQQRCDRAYRVLVEVD